MTPIPDDETLAKRREPKFVVNPTDVQPKDDIRIREWALGIMQKNLSRLDDKTPNKTIVYEKEIEPEEIDIRNLFSFKEMRYFIMRLGNMWSLRLLYKTPSGKYAILAEFLYANVDHI